MTLQEFLSRRSAPSKAEFARSIGMSPNYLYQMLGGFKIAGPRWIPAIVKATNGKVKPKDLNPKLANVMSGRV